MYLSSIAFTATLVAQSPLPLDEAVQKALSGNRTVAQSRLLVTQKHEDTAVSRTKRWPSLKTTVQVGPLLNRASATFPMGSFGNFAATGPIPARDTDVSIPRRIGGVSYSQVGMPLSQQPRIGLGIKAAELDEQATAKQSRRVEQEVTAQVRDLYFQITALESARKSVAAQLQAAEETARLAQAGRAEGTALVSEESEALARLERAKADLANLETDIRNGREQLNVLMGEPLDASFVLQTSVPAPAALSLEEARRRAMEARPEVAEARLRLQQAGVSVRAKRLEWVPDVSLTFTHLGFLNSSAVLPNQLALAGLSLDWEPWDWGRKKHETAAARSKEDQARLAAEQLEQQVQAEAGRAWREWERSQRNLEVARAQVKSAADSMRIARERYTNQAALLRDLLNSQAQWEAAAQQEARAVAAAGSAWTNLQLAIGE